MNSKRCPFCGKEINESENICSDCRIKINPHCEEAQNQPSVTGKQSQATVETSQQITGHPVAIQKRQTSPIAVTVYFVFYIIALLVCVSISSFLGRIGSINDGGYVFTLKDFGVCMVFSFVLTFILYIVAFIFSKNGVRILLILSLIIHLILLCTL